MKITGFEKREDGHWWIVEDDSGNVWRRSMSPSRYRIVSAKMQAEWEDDESRRAGCDTSIEGVARLHRESA